MWHCSAVLAGAILLALGVPEAGADATDDTGLPTLADVLAVMQAREASTTPFLLEFAAETHWSERVYWPGVYTGTLARSTDRFTIRRKEYLPREHGDRYVETDHYLIDRIIISQPGEAVYLMRGVDAVVPGWKGRISARTEDDGRYTPAAFGLFLWDWKPASTYLTRPCATITGRIVRDGQSCITALGDMSGSGDTSAKIPMLFWLSETHGYFPVRIEVYTRKGKRAYDDLAGDDVSLPDGTSARLATSFVASELAPVNEGWVASRGERVVYQRTASYRTDVIVTPGSVRNAGDLSPSVFQLPPDVGQAVIQDNVSGGTRIIGKSPFDVSDAELEATAIAVRSDGVRSQTEVSLSHGPSVTLIVMVVLGGAFLGCAVGVASRRLNARRRS